ncbi:MAG: dienelactone hydrolase family protein, partial [Dolichospermum sp.]
MTEPAINTSKIKIPAGNFQIDAYLAKPTSPGAYPGIIVLQEIFGVNVHIREVTERIAKLGYVAIAPALFQRQAPGFETGYTPEDVEAGRKYAWLQTTASELLSDIQAAINYLKTLPQVKKEGFG